MKLYLLEPFREMFKDEVRYLGKKMKVNNFILNRHPFPGPGLAIRILGDINQKKLEILQNIDYVFINELKKEIYIKICWQAFATLIPIKTVGVMGDSRTYEYICALRGSHFC